WSLASRNYSSALIRQLPGIAEARMNDVISATANERVVEKLEMPLRTTVLAGAFFGHRFVDAAAPVAAFPFVSPAEALATWFGQAEALRLAADPEACRTALDRDIAAIDTLLGEQLDALLHHPRVQRLEGSWRGLAWLTGGLDP